MPGTLITLKEYLRPDASPTESPAATLIFPVPPQQFTISSGKKVETKTLLTLGEVDFGGGTKVTEIQFATFFPASYDPHYCVVTDIPDPVQAVDALVRYAEYEVPIRLIIEGTSINLMVRLTELKTDLKGGEPGDYYVEMTFRRWTVVKPVKATAASPATPKREAPRPQAKAYTIKAGDTLSLIARRVYGDSSKWRTIYNANKAVIGSNPNTLPAGKTLTIP
jgi:nucleoid-associated protein YgaU